MEHWTAEWRDHKTDQLISCESPISLQKRPSVTFKHEPYELYATAVWDDMDIKYLSEDLGRVFLEKWLGSLWDSNHTCQMLIEYADVSLRRYENEKVVEDWYLEKCYIYSYNCSGTLINYSYTFELKFKFEKAYFLPTSPG